MVSILSYHECSVSPSLGLLCLFMTDREQRMLCLCYHYLANFALALAKGMSVVLGLVHPKAVIPSFLVFGKFLSIKWFCFFFFVLKPEGEGFQYHEVLHMASFTWNSLYLGLNLEVGGIFCGRLGCAIL